MARPPPPARCPAGRGRRARGPPLKGCPRRDRCSCRLGRRPGSRHLGAGLIPLALPTATGPRMIPPVTRRLSSPVFVGRRPELDRLEAAAERATEGRPSVVVVGGEAGVGKSRLID